MGSLRVLKELYIGISVSLALFLILGIIFIRPVWIYVCALLVGGAVAALIIRDTYITLDKALDMHSKGAHHYVTTRSLVRLVVKIILMVVAIMLNWVAFVGVTVGLLSPKISAYLNPMIKKYIFKDDGVLDTLHIEKAKEGEAYDK